MDKIKSFVMSTKGIGIISMTLAVMTLGVNYLSTKITNDEIVKQSAEKAAEIVLGTTENKETA